MVRVRAACERVPVDHGSPVARRHAQCLPFGYVVLGIDGCARREQRVDHVEPLVIGDHRMQEDPVRKRDLGREPAGHVTGGGSLVRWPTRAR